MLKVQTSILSYPIPKWDDIIESDRATARDVVASKTHYIQHLELCLPASLPESQLRNKVFDVIKGLDQVGVFLPITSDWSLNIVCHQSIVNKAEVW